MTEQEELLRNYKALKTAIQTGAKAVYYGDKRIEMRTLPEMQQILEKMEIELGLRVPGSGRTFADYNSGLQRNNRNCDSNDIFNTQ